MRKNVFMFPGVGSHKIGMGKSFYNNFHIFRETFREAGEILKIDLSELCFSPERKKELEQLENSQVALLTLCVGIYRVFQMEIGIKPQFFMGHSLGEYSALCCAGVIDFPDSLELVKQRGIILNEAASTLNGIMAWVINLDNKIVERVCEEARKNGEQVFVSAYDAPFQSSISGANDSVMKIGKILEKHGAIVYPLKMSGPFHCPLMKPAADKIKPILANYNYHLPVSPIIANFNALPYKDQNDVTENLSQQLTNPLRWQMSIRYIELQEVKEAVEFGADRVLKHLLKNNSGQITVFSLDNIEDMSALKCIPSFKNSNVLGDIHYE
jgi:[acyl-carrier-protein] S-malonyltransferase